MNKTTTRKIKTTIDTVVYRSIATIDWNGMTIENLQSLAEDKIVLNKQAADRRNKVAIASEYTLKALDYLTSKQAAVTAEQAAESLTIEQLEALLARKLAA